jgi:hypothetical protein
MREAAQDTEPVVEALNVLIVECKALGRSLVADQ